ncbi:TIGR03862 family flavoprotein [Bdellovibrionota bacterium FG-1]
MVGSKKTLKVGIVGTGPAGLMAAYEVAQAGYSVVLFEKRRGPGRKLLIAGSSGLNVTYDAPGAEFAAHYGVQRERFLKIFSVFSPQQWLAFIEHLGIKTFKGTSRRYFVEGLKASSLLRAWLDELSALGARLELGHECSGFEDSSDGVRLYFDDPEKSGDAQAVFDFDAVCFCLGGGSYEPDENPLRWPRFFREKGLGFQDFEASNVGFQVDWPPALLKEVEGKPIKNVVLSSSRGQRSGDLVITHYGVEGTPVYFAGEVGTVYLDLKPDLSEAQIRAKLLLCRENLSPIRRIKRFLNLGEGALALLFHLTPSAVLSDLNAMMDLVKRFPLPLRQRQPLSEAISSSGGLKWDGLDETFMLRAYPGVFVAGEMLDWDAPTGGFLIQGCVSQGAVAGQGIVAYLKSDGGI